MEQMITLMLTMFQHVLYLYGVFEFESMNYLRIVNYYPRVVIHWFEWRSTVCHSVCAETTSASLQWRRHVLEHGGGQFGVRTIGRAATIARSKAVLGEGTGGGVPSRMGDRGYHPQQIFNFSCSYVHFGV